MKDQAQGRRGDKRQHARDGDGVRSMLMSTATGRIEFSYEGSPVGYFESSVAPQAPGRYRYMPFRGVGHYQMATALAKGIHPRCTVTESNRTRSFIVVSQPETGILELAEFQLAEDQ